MSGAVVAARRGPGRPGWPRRPRGGGRARASPPRAGARPTSSSRSQSTSTNARLAPSDAPEGELVVGLDRRAAGGRTARARPRRRRARPGREREADLVVEGDRAEAVADLVGDERDRGQRVQARVEHGEPRAVGPPAAAPRTSRPASTTSDHVAVLLDPVLVAHRAPEPRRRAPVDLADVVVGQVVAHELELRAEPERSARGDALVAEAALAHGQREPARGEQVRVDGHARGARPAAWCQAASPSGPVVRVPTAGSSWRPRRRGDAAGRRARRRPRAGSSAMPGGDGLAQPHARPPAAPPRVDAQRRPARRARARPAASRSTRGRAAHGAARRRAAAASERRRPRAPRRGERHARSAASASAASSAAARGVGASPRDRHRVERVAHRARRRVKRSSSASGVSTSRWRSTGHGHPRDVVGRDVVAAGQPRGGLRRRRAGARPRAGSRRASTLGSSRVRRTIATT